MQLLGVTSCWRDLCQSGRGNLLREIVRLLPSAHTHTHTHTHTQAHTHTHTHTHTRTHTHIAGGEAPRVVMQGQGSSYSDGVLNKVYGGVAIRGGGRTSVTRSESGGGWSGAGGGLGSLQGRGSSSECGDQIGGGGRGTELQGQLRAGSSQGVGSLLQGRGSVDSTSSSVASGVSVNWAPEICIYACPHTHSFTYARAHTDTNIHLHTHTGIHTTSTRTPTHATRTHIYTHATHTHTAHTQHTHTQHTQHTRNTCIHTYACTHTHRVTRSSCSRSNGGQEVGSSRCPRTGTLLAT